MVLQLVFRGVDGAQSRWCVHDDEDRHVGALYYKGEHQWACEFADESVFQFEASDADTALSVVQAKFDTMDKKPGIEADEESPQETAYIEMVNAQLEALLSYAQRNNLVAAHARAISVHVGLFAYNTASNTTVRRQIVDLVVRDANGMITDAEARQAAMDKVGGIVGKLLEQGGLGALAQMVGGNPNAVMGNPDGGGDGSDEDGSPKH